MVETRSGEHTAAENSNSAKATVASNSERQNEKKTKSEKIERDDIATNQEVNEDNGSADKRKHDEVEEEPEPEDSNDSAVEQPPAKAAKPDPEVNDQERKGAENSQSNGEKKSQEVDEVDEVDEVVPSKIRKAIVDYGSVPLEGTAVKEPTKAAPETLLAMVLEAMLTSTRISHNLAQQAVNAAIDAGYHDIKRLSESTWEERVNVMAEGGYNRYREQTATRLGHLSDLINSKYDGDLNNMLKKSDSQPEKIRELVKEINGIGDLGVDLFFNNAQSVWPCIAPFIDARSLHTAKEVGIGDDLDAIFAELDHDPVEMSKLARGLSEVRLSKHEKDIEAEE